MTWQPIETAPIGETVLVWALHEDGDVEERSMFAAKRNDVQPHVWWLAGTLDCLIEATHWMPLPSPPPETSDDQ